LGTLMPTAGYAQQTYDLSAAMATAGFSNFSHIQIKFQHYDNNAIPTDGFGFDDISVSCVASTATPTMTPTVTPTFPDVPFGSTLTNTPVATPTSTATPGPSPVYGGLGRLEGLSG